MTRIIQLLTYIRNKLTDCLVRYNINEIPEIKSLSIRRRPATYKDKKGEICTIILHRKDPARYSCGEIYLCSDFIEFSGHTINDQIKYAHNP